MTYSQEDLINVYDHIYSKGDVLHPDKGKGPLGAYASHDNRDGFFINWITKNFEKGSRILDASCGRGHLAISLHERGYKVEATEVSKWLMKNDLGNLPFPVHLLRYDQLDRLPSNSFDVVCSNDVLEHMIDKDAALAAVDHLIRLSRSALCLSIGMSRSMNKYTAALGIDKKCRIIRRFEGKMKRHHGFNMHTFTPGAQWWKNQLFHRVKGKAGGHTFKKRMHQHLLIFGWVKDEEK